MPHRAFLLALLDLKIRNRGQQLGIPVDQTLVTIDQAVAVHLDKYLDDGMGQAVIQGEPVSLPVRGCAKSAHLALDRAAGFRLPLPHSLEERLASHVTPVDILCGKLAFNDHLCGDAGMILAWLPQGVPSLHAMITDQQILKRERQRMSHMQAAGHVRRRHHDRIGRRLRCRIAGKSAAGLPTFVPAVFDGVGVVGLREFGI